MPKLTFRKQNQTLELKEGTELVRLPHLTSAVSLPFGCCLGTCGTCAIKVVRGEEHLSPRTKQEQITLSNLGLDGYRLACQCTLKSGDVVLDN
jgi:ferredoxin